jgi:hypothetical protein
MHQHDPTPSHDISLVLMKIALESSYEQQDNAQELIPHLIPCHLMTFLLSHLLLPLGGN